MLSKKKKEEKKEEKKNPFTQGKTNLKSGLKDGRGKYWLVLESMTSGLEKHYFTILRFLREKGAHGVDFDKIIKVKDFFDASVSSSFHGQLGTKMSAMQREAAQYMATLGSMVKTVFPIVSELRKVDERMEYYEKSLKGDESAEIALKSIWIEIVEQGMQNPNSVYSLSTKVGYLSLPDLFFRINPKDGSKGVDNAIKSLIKEGVPKRVADVCAKKLYSYYVWKEKTYKELQFTREFKLKYLKQHYQSIKMYMNWVRPYLKTIQQLQLGPQHKGSNFEDPDIINAFETAKIEVELLARGQDKGLTYYPVVQIRFNFVSRPEMIYTPQGQKQPVHAGRTEIEIIPIVATQEEIDEYIEMQKAEDIELLAALDESMMALKDDLKKYLGELGEFKEEKEEEKKEEKKETVWSLFGGIGTGFKDLFGAFGGITFRDKDRKKAKKLGAEKKKAEGTAQGKAWLLYYVFKKANKLYTEI
ncbi:hypothetical protein D6777_02115 [Candidatus Woesearchaeota archaeon]|nr:MAG: hypothetical protein D6777_02115 [Candidatus Woesearchaeota archaeon]